MFSTMPETEKDSSVRHEFESYLVEVHGFIDCYFDRRADGTYVDDTIEIAYGCWIKAYFDGLKEGMCIK